MSTAQPGAHTTTIARFRLPEPPERRPDEVTSYDYVYAHGTPLHLQRHLGNPESTLVTADKWLVADPDYRPFRRPDLMIAFDVSPELYFEQNGYVISDQGKPPDFVLEVASPSTAQVDTGEKRAEYAALGIPEYWRFDHTGDWHGSRLAGDRLVDHRYEPIPIREIEPDVLQGYSAVLNLYLRWDHGEFHWYDPDTGEHIATFDSEHQARLAAERRASDERAARLASELRVAELEAELEQLRRQQRPGADA